MRHTCCHTLARLLAAGLFLCLVPAATSADIVRLKNGSVLRGEIIKDDENTVTLRVPYGTMIINKSYVKSVEKEDEVKNQLVDADALLQAGQTDAAIRRLEETVRRFPEYTPVRDKLVTVYHHEAARLREAGQVLEADKLYRRILELDPDNDEALQETRTADEVRGNAEAAEEEARLLTALERYREALEVFERLETFVPGSAERNKSFIAECHAGYGRRLLEFKRFTEARSHYNTAVQLRPELLSKLKREVAVARFSPIVTEINEKGKSLSRARWETLAAEIKAILPLDKDNPQVRYALAACYHELGQYEDAAREYALVTGEKPDLDHLPDSLRAVQKRARDLAEKSPIMLGFPYERFTSVRPGKPQILETVHFVIHHHNDELALLVARGAEYYLKRNYKVFLDEMPSNPWPKKCDIHIYRSQEEYLKNSRQADWSPAMASTSAIAGTLESHQIVTYQTVEGLLPSHLSHEITHIIHSSIVNYAGAVPTWLREGTAVRQEPWWKRIRMAKVIRQARDENRLLTLEQIINQQGYPDGELVNLFYSQSYALVEALERVGTKEQFRQFSQQVVGTPALGVIEHVYGLDREALVEQWQKHQNDLISLLDEP